MKQKFIIFLLMFLGAGMVTLRGQPFQVLATLGSGEGGQPYAGLALQGNMLFGLNAGEGASGNGNVFGLNTNGGGLQDLHDFTFPSEASYCRAGFVVSGNTLYAPGYGGGSANSYGTIFAISTNGTGYTNLHVFAGTTDGSDPRGAIVLSSNVLYGTTQYTSAGATGNGTVFSVNTNGTGFTTLFTFAGTNGSYPYGGMVLASNMLYGTTYQGGSANLGAIFSLTTDGKTFTLLHSFSNTNGTLPAGGLILSGGTLYGTASSGGVLGHNYGTIFSMGTNGSNFTVLYNFTGTTSDGDTPLAGLLLSGNLLYGTASCLTSGHGGTIFSISTNGTNFNLLNSFTGGADGGDPEGPLILAGNSLYGTTVSGGDPNTGNGTIFSLQISGVVFAEQPASATNLSPGATASFSYGGYSIAGYPLQVQWRLNGVNIPGATYYPYAVTNAQPTNGGLVTIAVSDGFDAPNSTVAAFSVLTSLVVTNNDYFTNRYQLPGTSGVLDGNNTLATKEVGEPNILPNNPGGKSVWFKWVPQLTGIAVLNTAGSAFDTMMGVYTGTSVANLVREPSAISDDDSGGFLTSKISFNCTVGKEYEIVVDGYRGASGSIVLTWSIPSQNVTLPVILSAPPALTVTSNGGSVTLVCQVTNGVPVWFFNGQATAITGPTNVISPVSATNVGTWIAQVTTSGGVATTQTAVIEISTLEDGSTDTNSAALNKFLNSVSTTFAQTSLPVLRRQDGGGDTRGFSVSQVFSTVGAPGEPGEPNIAGQIGGSPVWYKYVTPTNGSLVVNTTGSSFNTLLGVFTGPGDSFATLTSLGQGYTSNRVLNGQPQIAVTNVPAGQTNYIVVDGYQAASGTVKLNIALGNVIVISPALPSQFVAAGSNATFTVSATGSTPLSYFWSHAGTNIPAATNATLTITNAQATSTGTYTVLVSNAVSLATNSATLTLGTLPAITTQSVSHTIHTNTTASLTVAANGTPTPTYQWLFNGTNTGTPINSLTIPNFASTNQGSYWVVVSNTLGVASSSNAILLLDSPFRAGTLFLTSGVFQVQLIGASGSNYVLEASTNLVTWLPLATNKSPVGFISLTDTNAANFKYRFYRAMTN